MTGLDMSDFPALADRCRREGSGNPTPLLNPLAGRAPYGKGEEEQGLWILMESSESLQRRILLWPSSAFHFTNHDFILVGMVTKPAHEQSQDFSIHNEDFPALPGPNFKDPTCNVDDSKSVCNSYYTQTTLRGLLLPFLLC